MTVNLLPGQDVFTVTTMAAKIEALLRGMGCGYVPEPMVREHLRSGRLVQRHTQRAAVAVAMGYAWRCANGPANRASLGLGLQWWLQQLSSATTRQALLERHTAS